MTYDSSVFQGETITKIVFISKIQKDFGIYLLLIFRYIAKKRSMLLRKGQPVRQTASSAPKLRLRRGGLPPRTVKSPGYLRPDKKTAPETGTGRSFKAGWRIASAGVINRHRFRCCKITLRLFHRCDSPVTIPGIWHYTHVAAAGKAARPHHPATKAACPDCKRPGRPCRITGSATIAIRRRPASHSGRAGIIPYSHSIVAGGFEEMS